jgi:DNA-binding transcriptional LysR family regulator
MVPTARARTLSVPLREALRQVEDALSSVARFDPTSASETFRISGSDYFSGLMMPGLVRLVREEAPGLTLQMLHLPTGEIAARLGDGTVDLALDAEFDAPEWVGRRSLHRSFIVSVARRGDPRLEAAGVPPGGRIPAELFCALPQVLMSMDGGRSGTIDRALAGQGLSRRVALTVPHFQALLMAVAESGLLGNLPVHFARRMAPALGLELFLPPVDPPLVEVMLFWHRSREGDAAQAWLRERIARVLDLGCPGEARLPVP